MDFGQEVNRDLREKLWVFDQKCLSMEKKLICPHSVNRLKNAKNKTSIRPIQFHQIITKRKQ